MVDPAPGKSCGSCTSCCKVVGIEELQKPAGVYCSHCTVGVGCGIYPERPGSCRTFMCAWLYNPLMGPELKPEKTHVVIWESVDRRFVAASCDPDHPDAWRAPAVINFLRQVAVVVPRDWNVEANNGAQAWRISPFGTLSKTGEASWFVDHHLAPLWRVAIAR